MDTCVQLVVLCCMNEQKMLGGSHLSEMAMLCRLESCTQLLLAAQSSRLIVSSDLRLGNK